MKILENIATALLTGLLLGMIMDVHAACASRACVSAGPRLAGMDTQQASLYNATLSQTTGQQASLTVADWNGLAAGGSNADFLATYDFGQMSAGEPTQLSGDSLGLGGTVEAAHFSAQLTEAPTLICGPVGTTFRSAAVRTKMDLDLFPLAPDVSAIAGAEASLTRLSLYTETGRGSGLISTADAAAGTVSIRATPGVASLYVGSIADSVFRDRSRPLDPASDLDFAPVGSLRITDPVTGAVTEVAIEARGQASGQGATSTLAYAGPYPRTRTATSGAGFAANLAVDLANSLEIRTNPDLGAMDGQVQEVLAAAVRQSLAPVLASAVQQAANPALGLFGIGLGEMDVTVESLTAACRLAGHVYHDANHDGARAGSEAGTAQACYVKLLPVAAGGPVIQVVAADPASGAYRFDTVPIGSYRVVVNRDSDAGSVAAAPPAGWVATEPRSLQRSVTLAGSDADGQDFGLYPGSRVSGTVFRDNGSAANNGIQEADEPGLAGIAVQAAAGATPYDSTVTAGNGTYTLWLPTAAGTVRVTESNGPAMVSVAGSPGSTGGSYDRNLDTVTFSPTAGNAYSGVDFADVPANTFSGDHRQTAPAGGVAFFPHVFVAGSAGRLTLAVGGEASPTGDWSSLTYVDVDCDGNVSAAEMPLAGPIDLLTGQKLCLVLKTFVPAGAPANAQYAQTLATSFIYANAGVAGSLSRGDLVVVGAAGLKLVKTVNKATAGPGETIAYAVRYENQGAESLRDLKIRDATPAYTVFAAADCAATPAGVACAVTQAPAIGASGTLEWRFTGPLAAGATGSVSFSVTVKNQQP